tara:strand:- start:153 stop:500 length:348 start_codon:yes stop_codon:yes gene_type:complete
LQTVCYSVVLKFYSLLLSPSLGEHNKAIADFTTAIKLYPDDKDTYNDRGLAYQVIGEYKSAISDYTSTIRLDSDYAHVNRGVAKYRTGLSRCGDYKKACELGFNKSCDWHNDQCR